MQSLTAQDIADAIEDVAVTLPHLKVHIGSCHGRDWLVDTADDIVYVSAQLPLARWGHAALDALDALCDHHRIRRPHRGRVLRLIPTPREDKSEARTGTAN